MREAPLVVAVELVVMWVTPIPREELSKVVGNTSPASVFHNRHFHKPYPGQAERRHAPSTDLQNCAMVRPPARVTPTEELPNC